MKHERHNNAAEEQSCERERRLLAMGQMAATLAHEIRNPLGSLDLFCSLLLSDLKDRPDSHRIAQQMQGSIRRLDRIVANCLQFTRDVTPCRSRVANFGNWLNELVDSLRPQAESASVELRTVVNIEGPVDCDPFLLGQILTNLVLNGVQAYEKGSSSRKREVVISVTAANAESLTIKIADNGCGIPAQAMTQIFDPFFSTKTTGTGLGLAVVQSLVSALGGWIDVQSNPDQGTTFELSLPKTLDSAQHAGEQRDERKGECINC